MNDKTQPEHNKSAFGCVGLKSSGIIWDDRSLDGWLTDPDGMVPDNEMPFSGIKDARMSAPTCLRS